MEQPTMKVIDDSYFENDDAAESGMDLSPIELDPIEDDGDFNANELTIKQVLPGEEPATTHTPQTPVDQDVVTMLLKSKGITDPTNIKFEDEDGTETTRDFYSLSAEEQLELLNTNEADIDYGLEEAEIEAVNFLRENKVTLEELIEYHRNAAVEEFQRDSQDVPFEIDGFTDEELYVLDLKAKFDDFTNEELEIKLTKALENPDLFKKEIDKIRSEYKSLEEQDRNATAAQIEQQQEEAFGQIASAVADVASKIDDMYGIQLEEQDKEDIINAIIDRDINGVTPLVKALDNPDQLFKAAWFVTKGEEAFKILHNYYAKQIEDVRKTSYTKGKEEALKGFPTKPITRISSIPNPAQTRQTTPGKKVMTMDDLHNIND